MQTIEFDLIAKPFDGKTWIAQITGRHAEFHFEREFIPVSRKDVSRRGNGTFFYEVGDGLYEVCEAGERYFVVIEDGEWRVASEAEVASALDTPEVEAQAEDVEVTGAPLEALESEASGAEGMDWEVALVRHQQDVGAAKATLDAERSDRDEAIRSAISAGMTMYRIAQLTGLSQQAVARIRDAG